MAVTLMYSDPSTRSGGSVMSTVSVSESFSLEKSIMMVLLYSCGVPSGCKGRQGEMVNNQAGRQNNCKVLVESGQRPGCSLLLHDLYCWNQTFQNNCYPCLQIYVLCVNKTLLRLWH